MTQLLLVADTYSAATGRGDARVSNLALGAGHRLPTIRNGGSASVKVVERAIVWFSHNWPDGVAWPADVPRPLPSVDPTPASSHSSPEETAA